MALAHRHIPFRITYTAADSTTAIGRVDSEGVVHDARGEAIGVIRYAHHDGSIAVIGACVIGERRRKRFATRAEAAKFCLAAAVEAKAQGRLEGIDP